MEDDLRRNLLLAALPEASFEALAPKLRTLEVQVEQRLFPQEENVDVFFPLDAVISLIRNLSDGESLEIYMAGPEGLTGTNHILGIDRNPHEGLVQARGVVARIAPADLRKAMAADAALRDVLLRFAYTMVVHGSQLACCNRLHVVEQRLAHWLLMLHDRTGADEMPLTQEFLARMLSTRRAGINAAMQSLERAGSITHARSRVRIVDREKLHDASCECYDTMREEYTLAMGFAPVAKKGRETPVD